MLQMAATHTLDYSAPSRKFSNFQNATLHFIVPHDGVLTLSVKLKSPPSDFSTRVRERSARGCKAFALLQSAFQPFGDSNRKPEQHTRLAGETCQSVFLRMNWGLFPTIGGRLVHESHLCR